MKKFVNNVHIVNKQFVNKQLQCVHAQMFEIFNIKTQNVSIETLIRAAKFD